MKVKLVRDDLSMRALSMKPGELYRVVEVTKPKRAAGWDTPASVTIMREPRRRAHGVENDTEWGVK